MYGSRVWSGLFTEQPKTVLDAYAQSSDALNTARQNQIKTALDKINLNAAPTLMQQTIDQGAANTSIKQNQAQYAPLLSKLDVQQKQILNAMSSEQFKQMPQEFQANMAFKAQQIAELKQKMQLAPLQMQQQQGRFGAPYQLQRILSTLPPAAKAAFIAANPGVMNQILGNSLNNAANSSQPQQNPMMSNPNMQQNNQSSMPQSPQQNAGQLPFAVASQIAANKGSVNAQTSRRLDSAIEIEKILNNPDNDALAASAAKYAGIAGKIKGGLQAWSSSNPKDYENYLQFKNQFASMIANIMRQVEGLGVQESTREEIRGNILQAFDSMSSNPARALDQYNRLKAQMTQLTSAASTAAQPIYPGVREKQAGIDLSKPEDNQMVDIISPDGREGSIPTSKLEGALKNGFKRAS